MNESGEWQVESRLNEFTNNSCPLSSKGKQREWAFFSNMLYF
jgi:hypothetical protein